MDCSLPGSSVHGMFQARILEWVAISSSKGSSGPGIGHLMRRVDSLEKTDAGRNWGQEEKGSTEDEVAGWHHGLDGHESE